MDKLVFNIDSTLDEVDILRVKLHNLIMDAVMEYGVKTAWGYRLAEEPEEYEMHDHGYCVTDITGDGMWRDVKIRGIEIDNMDIYVMWNDENDEISDAAINGAAYVSVLDEIRNIIGRRRSAVHTQSVAPGNPS